MSRIKSKNSKPEVLLRKALFSKGLRYRLHSCKLPGKPDIVLSKFKSVVFMHGCFWHMHVPCPKFSMPTTNQNFWNEKLNKNKSRDRTNISVLKKMGWRVMVVWQCALVGKSKFPLERLVDDIVEWLKSGAQWDEVSSCGTSFQE